MGPDSKKDFIIIDDDPINNMICFKVIELTVPESEVRTFTSPEKGVDHLLATYGSGADKHAILFLDINMPTLTGWDVLQKMESFPAVAQDHIKVFMLSSSVDQQDRERANRHHLVAGYITKPLSQAKLTAILPETV